MAVRERGRESGMQSSVWARGMPRRSCSTFEPRGRRGLRRSGHRSAVTVTGGSGQTGAPQGALVDVAWRSAATGATSPQGRRPLEPWPILLCGRRPFDCSLPLVVIAVGRAAGDPLRAASSTGSIQVAWPPPSPRRRCRIPTRRRSSGRRRARWPGDRACRLTDSPRGPAGPQGHRHRGGAGLPAVARADADAVIAQGGLHAIEPAAAPAGGPDGDRDGWWN